MLVRHFVTVVVCRLFEFPKCTFIKNQFPAVLTTAASALELLLVFFFQSSCSCSFLYLLFLWSMLLCCFYKFNVLPLRTPMSTFFFCKWIFLSPVIQRNLSWILYLLDIESQCLCVFQDFQ